jgi:chitinase
VLGDTLDESNESFTLNVTAVANASPGTLSATGTILDDDDAPPVVLASIEPATVIEGDVGTVPASFRVFLDRAGASTVSVGWNTSAATATAGSDYQSGSGTLVFAPGQTEKLIVVQVIGDTQVETDEYFIVNLISAINAELDDSKASGTILDDDLPTPQPGVIALEFANLTARENDGSIEVRVMRLGGSDGAASVRVQSRNGSAQAPADYTGLDQTVFWGDGNATPIVFEIALASADGIEPEEDFFVDLSQVSGAAPGVPASVRIVIRDGELALFHDGFETR